MKEKRKNLKRIHLILEKNERIYCLLRIHLKIEYLKRKNNLGFGFQNCLILGLGLGFHVQFFEVLGVGMKPIPKTQTHIFLRVNVCY